MKTYFLCEPSVRLCMEVFSAPVPRYDDPDFRQLCTEEYLADRKRFRETGVWTNQKRKDKVI